MGPVTLELHVEIERENDGRWIADVTEIGVLAYGNTQDQALARAKVLAFQVITDRLSQCEDPLTGRKMDGASRPFVEYAAHLGGIGFVPVPVAG
jgi:predicted RNase H-like HicB family nuclease